MPDQPTSVLIVIVCYRAAELTIDCLRSLAPEVATVPGTKVVVCENGTGAESTRKIADAIEREGWQHWVTLKAIHPNVGFAGGNNVILREALASARPPECFLLLNADTVVRPGALKVLVDGLRQRPDVGIVSPRLEWPDGTPQISCFHYQSMISEMLSAARTAPLTKLFARFEVPVPVSDVPIQPQWTTFACALIRRSVIEQVGILDDGYYLYFDDVDYCRRARGAGWQVLHLPEARVVHLRGQSNPVKSLSKELKRRPGYFYASRSRYFAKFYGRLGLGLTNVLWTFGRLIALARELVGQKTRHTCEKEWLDIWTQFWNPMKLPPSAVGSAERRGEGCAAQDRDDRKGDSGAEQLTHETVA